MQAGKLGDCAALLGSRVEHGMGEPPEVQHKAWGGVQLIKGCRHEEMTLIASTHIKGVARL